MDKDPNKSEKRRGPKTNEPTSGINPKLLEMLVCPVTHGPLEYNAEDGELVSKKAGLAFPIRDGIPIMLVEEARELDQETNK